MKIKKSRLLKISAITIVLLFMEIILSFNTIFAEEVKFKKDYLLILYLLRKLNLKKMEQHIITIQKKIVYIFIIAIRQKE